MQRLDAEAVDDTARTHPVLVAGDDRQLSHAYTEPDVVVEAYNELLPEPPPDAARLVFAAGGLPGIRRFVVDQATRAGLAADRVADLKIAVNELATNTIAHTTGTGTLYVWREDNHVLSEIRDSGKFTDLLAGRLPPTLYSNSGRGLLFVNYFCDLVRIHTHKAGATIRLYMRVSHG